MSSRNYRSNSPDNRPWRSAPQHGRHRRNSYGSRQGDVQRSYESPIPPQQLDHRYDYSTPRQLISNPYGHYGPQCERRDHRDDVLMTNHPGNEDWRSYVIALIAAVDRSLTTLDRSLDNVDRSLTTVDRSLTTVQETSKHAMDTTKHIMDRSLDTVDRSVTAIQETSKHAMDTTKDGMDKALNKSLSTVQETSKHAMDTTKDGMDKALDKALNKSLSTVQETTKHVVDKSLSTVQEMDKRAVARSPTAGEKRKASGVEDEIHFHKKAREAERDADSKIVCFADKFPFLDALIRQEPLLKEKQDLTNDVADLRKEFKQKEEKIRKVEKLRIQERDNHIANLSDLKKEHNAELSDLKNEHKAELLELKREHKEVIANFKAEKKEYK